MTAVAHVGVGNWGRHIARDLVSLGCDVTAVCRSPESIERARTAGVDRIVSSIDQIENVDGIVISTPTITHAAVIDSIADLDVPVYVEKPLTTSSKQARELTDRLGDRLFVMEKWRYHGAVEKLAEIGESGRLGQIVGLRTRRVGGPSHHLDVDCSWNLLPHELSIGTAVFGEPLDPVAAVAANVDGSLVQLSVQLRGPGGNRWHDVEISVSYPGMERSMLLLCERGVVTVTDVYDDHVLVREYDADGVAGDPEPVAIDTEFPLIRQLRAFVEHLRGGPPPMSSAAEGIRSVELIEQIRELAGLPGSVTSPLDSNR